MRTMKRIRYYRRLARVFWSYKTKKTRLPYLPLRLWIEPTSICNLRCVMCPNKDLEKSQKGFMDFGLYEKIIEEARHFVFDVHLLHRGESLLHPDFFDMVKFAHNAGLVTRFHTNGTLLDEEKSRRLIEAGLDQFAFSFDGFDAETYERIRVNGDFEKTVGNIVRFLEIKKSLGARKPVTLIELINFPGLRESAAKSRDALVKRFEGLPLDKIYIKDLHNWAGDTGDVAERTSYAPCTFLWHALIIFWDGSVLPCTQDFFGFYVLGNVGESSISEVWNNDRMVSLRRKILDRDVADLKTCSRCDRLWRKMLFGIPREYLGRALRKRME
jgi:radical SAM protein with 4Fe4S-binding SPASM domain